MKDFNNKTSDVSESLRWKLIEQFSSSVSLFVLQMILARILGPDMYGPLALMIIFINIANVFIQNGFNISLVQRNDLKEDDYSSVFWVVISTSLLFFVLLYLCAPKISVYFNAPDLVDPFRFLILILFPGAVNSIQSAKLWREMNFKSMFICNISGICIGGIAGVFVAVIYHSIWALVLQSVISSLVTCIVMWCVVGWRPKKHIDTERLRILLSFGWKFMMSSLLDTIFNELNGMIIGKKYNTENLAYYDRGNRYSLFFINGINGSFLGVLLPTMSSVQDDKEKVRNLMRKIMKLSTYVVFPIMFGIAATADSIIYLVLREKWMGCVPYVMIFCISYAFWPVHTLNLYTYNAIGRSELYLQAEIIKKVFSILALIVAIKCFDSPFAIAVIGLVLAIPFWIINALPSKKYVGYSFIDQLLDVLPVLLLSCFMFAVTLFVGKVFNNHFASLFFQVIIGVMLYITLSIVFRFPMFFEILDIIKSKLNKRGVETDK